MLIVRYAQQPCPHCGVMLDSSASAMEDDDLEPHANDVSVCVACHGLLRWEERQDTGELWQVRLTPREFAKLPASLRSELLRAQAELERIVAERKAKERRAN